MKILTLFFLLFLSVFSLGAIELYRAPFSGDSGSYYILSSVKGSDGLMTVISSRVGKGKKYTDFTKLKVNCLSKQYIELAGSSEDGAKEKPTKPLKKWPNSKWTSLIPDSSKSALVNHVCKNTI